MSQIVQGDADPRFGFVEWFRMGDRDHALKALDGILAAGGSYLRTQLSWAEFCRPEGRAWYDWLIPTLGEAIELLPCVHYTPPSLSRTGYSAGPPRVLKDYADFVDLVLDRYGHHFRHIELWNEPNNLLDWDWREDPDHLLFCEMIGNAAHWAEHRGWQAVLAAPCPFDAAWLELMGSRGVLGTVSAIGIHGFPGTWDSEKGSWRGWRADIEESRAILGRFNPQAEVWITEAGFSTWDHGEIEQVRRFQSALSAPADRMYWYGWRDVAPDVPVQEGLWFDPRHYHLGAVDADEQPKLLARLLNEGGLRKLESVAALAAPSLRSNSVRPIAVIGGSGFIGANLAESLLADGEDVVIIDNLSRPGVEANLAWLRARHGRRVSVSLTDVRQHRAIEQALSGVRAVFLFAAQTAVTTSLARPVHDFEVNARGTLNVLEAIRKTDASTPVILASTNKVYGGLEDIALDEGAVAYAPQDPAFKARGVDESRPLDFSTPYGCSKGVADQYVLDYAHSYGMRTAVMRMSCIYGPHQFGTEDQGWVAHFLLHSLSGAPISIYGDGKQVRDVLHVSDAVAAYRSVLAGIDGASGQAFNLGGGPCNAISLNMLLDEIAKLCGGAPEVTRSDWRPRDQLYFVADTRKLENLTGWRPKTDWRAGVAHLADWLRHNRLADALPVVTPRRVQA